MSASYVVNIHSKVDVFAKQFLGVESKAAAAAANNNKKNAPASASAAPSNATAAAAADDESDNKLYLDHAEMGKVMTRFPPEASGFLHIGHAKALLINRMLADKYQGKMLFRYDDTNPAKEKHEFELAILHDMRLLNVGYDIGPTYSSDYFDKFIELAGVLIQQGDAYCDQTLVEQLRAERFDGVESKFRNASAADNFRLWKEMLAGSAEGQKTVLRAKIDMSATNKALRDPVLFRVNIETPHARTGTKYKAYPTYDFCCPIIDSLEGVTHALRTNEYHDRNAQYFWICDRLNLRKPCIQDFSRLNMEYSLMSKRKLTAMVEDGTVDGWDDPRFPTVRGLLRRGMSVAALREFVKVQGMSKAVNLMEWNKLWNFNNNEIDPVAPRYVAVDRDRCVTCKVTNFAAAGGSTKPLTRLRHKKNEKLGEKHFMQGPVIFLDSEDVLLLKEGEEVTLMDWGNAYVRNIKVLPAGDAGNKLPYPRAVSADIELNPTGDIKKTKYKLSWVADLPAGQNVSILVKEFEHLLLKKKPEEGDDMDAIVNKNTLFTAQLVGEAALAEVKAGQFLQLERRGFFFVDRITDNKQIVLHAVPDGRDKLNHLSAKAAWLKANPGAILPGMQLPAPAASSSAAAAGAAAAAPSAAPALSAEQLAALQAQIDAQSEKVKAIKAAKTAAGVKANDDEEVKAAVAKLLELKKKMPSAAAPAVAAPAKAAAAAAAAPSAPASGDSNAMTLEQKRAEKAAKKAQQKQG